MLQNPIFIVGFPRSGTTLLQSMVCTQPGLVSFPETHFFSVVTGWVKTDAQGTLPFEHIEEIIARQEKMLRFEISASLKREMFALAQHNQLTKPWLFEAVVKDFCLQQDLETKGQWVEKTPDHARFIQQIARYYPHACFLGITRHPLEAIDSFYEKLVAHRRPYLDLARQWLETVQSMEDFASQCPSRIYLLRYEDLIAHPETCLQDAFNHLALPYQAKLIKRFSEKAGALILPHETWKKSNVESIRERRKNRSFEKRIPFMAILKIQELLQEKMTNYGYDFSYKMLSSVYRLWKK
ncbi:sulfotransferase family protein [Catalinimonas alkaloidigena]|uniref:sulfotransferase family protein n=1 Tax=Catalinimonas alkaloidigena TaxID=1075417 RepID=UPI0015A42A01|nr:sulfotransferase [Catalinimonas alkaloidigena]